jgi:hypothetical protein
MQEVLASGQQTKDKQAMYVYHHNNLGKNSHSWQRIGVKYRGMMQDGAEDARGSCQGCKGGGREI